MIKIPSIQQMRELDAQTITEENIASIDLMERAAAAVTAAITRRWNTDVPVVVFAGPGNNGGDGLAVARQLSAAGYKVEAFLFNTTGRLSPDCETNRDRLKTCEAVCFTEVTAQFEPPQLTADKLIVDALFGTGLSRPLSGGYAALVKLINDASVCVVSIDVPSGLCLDNDAPTDHATVVKATHTITFQLPKLSMMLADHAAYWGQTEVVDIRLSQQMQDEMPTNYFLIEESDVRPMLQPRPPFGHKGTFGHALLIAGRYGMAGAAILAAKACLRSGVGKTTVHTPQMNNNLLQIAVPEATMSHDPSDTIFTTSVDTRAYAAVGIGPGIGTEHATATALLNQIDRMGNCPLLLDADAINILSTHPGWLSRLPRHCILTPHPGELSRLVHRTCDSRSALSAAIDIATRHQLYVVLKGHRTAICTPEGQVYFNPTGNSGMGTAGSGDVLTGIITALLARHYSPLRACLIGVYLHGLAGDIAVQAMTEDALIAGDIVDHLPEAFRKLRTATSPAAPRP